MAKNHNYTRLKNGEDFTVEIDKNGVTGDMIGQGKIEVGDYITTSSNKYRVIELEHYSEPSDMWRARLVIIR